MAPGVTDQASSVPVSLSTAWQVFWLEARPTLHAFPGPGTQWLDLSRAQARGFRHLSQRRNRSRFARDSLLSELAPGRSFSVAEPVSEGRIERSRSESAERACLALQRWRMLLPGNIRKQVDP